MFIMDKQDSSGLVCRTAASSNFAVKLKIDPVTGNIIVANKAA
jgi:hypothetical protein